MAAQLMQRSPSLPAELTDQVMGNLCPHKRDKYLYDENWQNQKKALSSCALVCRAWVPAAQRNLFSTLTINEHNCNEIVQYLAGAAARNNIASYVKRLCVHLWGDLRANINRSPASAIPLLHTLLHQITHFTNVTEMELDGCRNNHEQHWDVRWTDSLASAFPSLHHLNVLHIAFENVADLVDLVCAFPLLTHVTANELDFVEASHEHSNEPQEPYSGSKVPPQTLECVNYTSGGMFASGGGPFLRWIADGPQAINTLYLDLDAEAGDVLAGVSLIAAAGHNLKSLSLRFSDQWNNWEDELEFSGNDALRSLLLQSASDFGGSLTDLLETIKSPLEHLSLGVHDLDDDAWPGLINVLVSPPFSSLKKITLYGGEIQESVDELMSKISDDFPELLARGTVAFVTNDQLPWPWWMN